MHLNYIAPFRIDFDLDKDFLLAKWKTWTSLINDAEKELSGHRSAPDTTATTIRKPMDVESNSSGQMARHARIDPPKAAMLGNYAWGLIHKLTNESEVTHGEAGIEDPSWFFRRFYTIAFEGSFEGTVGAHADDPGLQRLLEDTMRTWHCRLIDNTVGVLVLSGDFALNDFVGYLRDREQKKQKAMLIEFGKGWSDCALEEISGAIFGGTRLGDRPTIATDGIHSKRSGQGVFLAVRKSDLFHRQR